MNNILVYYNFLEIENELYFRRILSSSLFTRFSCISATQVAWELLILMYLSVSTHFCAILISQGVFLRPFLVVLGGK